MEVTREILLSALYSGWKYNKENFVAHKGGGNMELTREILDDVLRVFGRGINEKLDEMNGRFNEVMEELREIKKILRITEAKIESHDRKFTEIGKIAVG